MAKSGAVSTLWLAPLIALGPLVHGLIALASPDLILANRAWLHETLNVTQAIIWTFALATGLRMPHLLPGFSQTDKIALALLLLIALTTSTLVAPAPEFSLMFLAMALATFFTGISLRYIIESAQPALARQLALAIFLSMLLFLPCLFVLLANWPQDSGFNLVRGIPGYINVRRWGFILAAAIAIGSGLLTLTDLSRLARWAILAGLVILWTALCWSGTRGGIAALIAALAVSAAVSPARMRPLVLPLALTILLGAALSLALPNPDPAFGLWNAASRAVELPEGAPITEGRMPLWVGALRAIAERPVFGHGYGQNFFVNDAPIGHTQTHNAILEVLLGWGFVGGFLAIFLALKLWTNACLLVRRTDDPLRLAAFTLLNTMALFSLVDGALFHMDSLFTVAVACAILFARLPATLPAATASVTEPRS